MRYSTIDPLSHPAADLTLARLVQELTDRFRQGESVDVAALAQQYPQYAEQLRELLPIVQSLAELDLTAFRGDRTCGEESGTPAADQQGGWGTIGDYQILKEIGRGGMGIVYEARQISLNRRVALKVLPFAAALDPRALQRFRHESLAAAQLDQPHIVHVYGVGTDRGVHYYAMQYIEGQSLAQVIAGMKGAAHPFSREAKPSVGKVGEEIENCKLKNENCKLAELPDAAANARVLIPKSEIRNLKLTSSDIALGCASRLNTVVETVAVKRGALSTHRDSNRAEYYRGFARMGIQAAEALDYAHMHGVLHRDVKPGNLLIDGQGDVWITDFGLARIESVGSLTHTGDLMGTLRYMSPEQILAQRGLVDQRTDVYSLGVTLYEVLTLVPAFSAESQVELLKQIAQDDPKPLRQIDSAIPEELETIVLKCLEKEPAGRYATAQALADDLGRFLANRPIIARRAGSAEMFRKWSRRHQTGVLAAAASLFVSTAILAASTFWVVHEQEQTDRHQTTARRQTVLADTRQKTLRQFRYVANFNSAENAWRRGALPDARDRLNECRPKAGEEDLRGFEWHLLWRMTGSIEYSQKLFNRHQGEAYCAQFSPNGKLLATSGQDGVRIWNWPGGEQLAHLTGHASDVNEVAFSPDGRLLVSAGDDRTARVWNTKTWQEDGQKRLEHKGAVVGVAFSPDGQTLATAERHVGPPGNEGLQEVVRLTGVETWQGKPGFLGKAANLESLTFSPDGTKLGLGSDWGRIVDVASRTLTTDLPHASKVNCVAFSHTRPVVASAGADGLVDLYDLGNPLRRETLPGHTLAVESVAFSPYDDALVTASRDGTLRLWEFTRTSYQMHSRAIVVDGEPFWCATFAPDGRSIVTTSRDGSIKCCERKQAEVRRRFIGATAPHYSYPIEFTKDGTKLIIIDDGVKLIDVETATELRQLSASNEIVLSLAISADRSQLAAGGGKGGGLDVIVWDTANWQRRYEKKSHACGRFLTFVPGEKYDLIAGRPLGTIPGDGLIDDRHSIDDERLQGMEHVAFSADGKTAATIERGLPVQGVVSGPLRIQDWPSGESRQEQRDQFTAVTFSFDGAILAAGRLDGIILLWRTDWKEEPIVLAGHGATVLSLAFTPDGKTLASAGADGAVKLWHVETGRELMTLDSQSFRAGCVRFSPDGRILASSGEYLGKAQLHEVLIWNSTVPR